jgi:hypothetical protein
MSPEAAARLDLFLDAVDEDDIYYTLFFYETEEGRRLDGFGTFTAAEKAGAVRALREYADALENHPGDSAGHTLQ